MQKINTSSKKKGIERYTTLIITEWKKKEWKKGNAQKVSR